MDSQREDTKEPAVVWRRDAKTWCHAVTTLPFHHSSDLHTTANDPPPPLREGDRGSDPRQPPTMPQRTTAAKQLRSTGPRAHQPNVHQMKRLGWKSAKHPQTPAKIRRFKQIPGGIMPNS